MEVGVEVESGVEIEVGGVWVGVGVGNFRKAIFTKSARGVRPEMKGKSAF